jgi:hypothetical protein
MDLLWEEDKQYTINVTVSRVRVINFAVQKQDVFWVCVPSLVTQHAKRMRMIILSSLACLGQQYFSTLPHKCHDFRKKS